MLIESVRNSTPYHSKLNRISSRTDDLQRIVEYRTMFRQLHVRTYREFAVRKKDQQLTSREDTESVENQW